MNCIFHVMYHYFVLCALLWKMNKGWFSIKLDMFIFDSQI